MNQHDQALMLMVTDRLRPLAQELIADGWQPELVVLAPSELERLPGYKIALVVPLDTMPDAA